MDITDQQFRTGSGMSSSYPELRCYMPYVLLKTLKVAVHPYCLQQAHQDIMLAPKPADDALSHAGRCGFPVKTVTALWLLISQNCIPQTMCLLNMIACMNPQQILGEMDALENKFSPPSYPS